MKILVVYCHPVETSFNAEIHRTAVAALRAAGHAVEDVDLYAENFDPVLRREDRLEYHDQSKNRLKVQRYVDLLQWAEGLVFVFPTWCYGLPAMLKGWFDRVLLPGVSFELTEDGRAVPALRNIKRVAGLSTYGRPWWVATFVMSNLPKRHIVRYFKLLSGGRAKTSWLAHYDMNRSTPATRAAFLAKVDAQMKNFA
jgi:putative NADPH-quinone reductase